jgi:hypothetical protein
LRQSNNSLSSDLPGPRTAGYLLKRRTDALREGRLVLRGMMRLDMGYQPKRMRQPRFQGERPVSQSKTTSLLRMGLLLAGLMAVALPAQAQQSEPQTQSYRAKIKAKYLEKRARFMHRVKDLYFAAGCKVLAGEAGIMPLTSSESYLAYIGDQTIVDTKDEAARQAAARDGQELAAKPGECDYFRRHPEAAEAARRTIAQAKGKP